MAKINLVEEVLKHSDEEIIDYLATEMAKVQKAHNEAMDWDEPSKLYTCGTTIRTVSGILSAMDKRNKQKSGQDEPVVL